MPPFLGLLLETVARHRLCCFPCFGTRAQAVFKRRKRAMLGRKSGFRCRTSDEWRMVPTDLAFTRSLRLVRVGQRSLVLLFLPYITATTIRPIERGLERCRRYVVTRRPLEQRRFVLFQRPSLRLGFRSFSLGFRERAGQRWSKACRPDLYRCMSNQRRMLRRTTERVDGTTVPGLNGIPRRT